jgi:hypothetical protein
MNGKTRDWTSNEDKFAAIRDVSRHILAQNDEEYGKLRDKCLEDNSFAKQLFKDVGKIEPSADAKVVFVAAGDGQRPDKGSLLLEPPPATASSMSDQELLDNYLLSSYLAKPSTSASRKWENLDDRAAAVVDVLRHVMANPTEGQECVRDDQHSCDLFAGPVGKIQPPKEIKIVFMPPGQVAAQAGGSLVLEVPAQRLTDLELVQSNTKCCYNYWVP